MRMMIAAACVSVALGATACNKKQNSTTTNTGGTNTTTSSGSNSSTPKPKSDSAPVLAMESFIAAMGEADFGDAVAFVDPSSELHKKMSDTASNLENLRSKGGANSGEAIKTIEVMFSAPYKKAAATLVTEEADRAIVELERAGFPPTKVNLTKSADGAWLISASDELFAPAMGGNKPPAPESDEGEGDEG